MEDANSYLGLFFEPIRPFLEDDAVSEILINGPNQVFIELKGKLQSTEARFVSEPALKAAAVNVAKNVGRLLNEDNPRLDARLPDGSRVHAVIPPLARCGTVVAIRKFQKEHLTIGQLIAFGSITADGAQLIDTLVKLHKNVIVSGATSSGKTSVLNVLSSFIPENERILVIEDASELQLQQKHTVCFETRKPDKNDKGEVTIRDLIHSALRAQVASAVNVVVHTARLSDGARKITAVSEVLGLKNGDFLMQDLYLFKTCGIGQDGSIDGHFTGTGSKPTFLSDARLRKLPLNEAMFEPAAG